MAFRIFPHLPCMKSPDGGAPKCCAILAMALLILGFLFPPCLRSAGAQLPADSAVQPNENNSRCFSCHGDASIASMRPEALAGMVRVPEGQQTFLRPADKIPALYTSADLFAASAHRGLSCTDCHLGSDALPHAQKLPSLQCADCHSNVQKEIEKGPHGLSKPGGGKPTCADCHGSPHEVPRRDAPRPHESSKAIVEACSKCHNKEGSYGFNPAQSYRDNIHAKGLFTTGLTISATCSDCHGNHAVLPSKDPDSPLSAVNTPKTCGACHQGIEDEFKASIHGRILAEGKEDAPTCTSCHKSHGIHAIDKPYLANFVKECSNCHLELGKSYLASYHGKAVQLSDYSSAICSSCHGAHNILPKSDPKSRVAPGNLVATCGECHTNVNDNFVKYIAHMDIFDRKGQPIIFYTWAIMTTLLCSVLLFFIPHTLLYFKRSLFQHIKHNGITLARQPKDERLIRRFTPFHRFTHGLIIISFMGLVATGFPLKFSHTGWAQSLTAFFGGVQFMGLLHRILAIVTFAYAGIHAIYLVYFFLKHRPRPLLKFLFGPHSMILNFKDIKDFIAMVRWFFWLGPRPRFDRWTYFEKFDYWGEIWGVFLIGGTGLLLWVPTWFTRWLPGWVLNCATVVHSIEALLAASVIFLVHFVNTHLRPEKFPVDMVMFTGYMPESELKEERPVEYERLQESGELDALVVPPMAFHWRLIGAILGIISFMCGLALIVLALVTEIRNYLG